MVRNLEISRQVATLLEMTLVFRKFAFLTPHY